jgi:hypothetical protein
MPTFTTALHCQPPTIIGLTLWKVLNDKVESPTPRYPCGSPHLSFVTKLNIQNSVRHKTATCQGLEKEAVQSGSADAETQPLNSETTWIENMPHLLLFESSDEFGRTNHFSVR